MFSEQEEGDKKESENNAGTKLIYKPPPLRARSSAFSVQTNSAHDFRFNRAQGAIPKQQNAPFSSVGQSAHRFRNQGKNLSQHNGDRDDLGKNWRLKSEAAGVSRPINETRKNYRINASKFVPYQDRKQDNSGETSKPNSRANSPAGYRQTRNMSYMDKMKEKKLFSDNKIKEKKDYDVPQRMNWMIEFSEMDGLEIVAKLANSHSGFENVIKDAALLQKKPDIIVLIMKMLHKVGEADFKETKASVLSKACNQEFLEQLKSFMMKLPTNEYKNEAFNVNDFLTDVLKFSESILTLMPTFASEKFNGILYMVHMTFVGMEAYANVTIRDEVKELHQRLQKLLAKSTEENKEKKGKLTSKAELQSLEAPPNNFRDINLIPTADDIFTKEHVFVRPNLIHGAYTSVEHYLDVHFRLLHEDFLNPMREGINEFVKKVETQKIRKNKPITNVRFYPNVVFLRPKVVNDRIGITVNFDPKGKFKNINWRTSKRFMYGGLLCFTQDNFRTFFFGTIAEREEKDLQNGMIVIELCVGSQIRDDLFSEHYAMAESEVYFEPYYQVLKALREMTEDDFPMRRYIVEAQTEGHPPAYILKNPQYTIESFVFPPLSPELWPSAEELGLDDSQYNAFKLALTREFVVVQGPPGTGKTFLGLKVAGVLLENKQIWNADKKPILIVCYTNHALDQFLEGLLKYTNKIARAGGRSKNENLEDYNMRNLRRKWKQDNTLDFEFDEDQERRLYYDHLRIRNKLGQDIHETMQHAASDIKMIQLDLEQINKNEGIISLELLHERKIIDERHYNFFKGECSEEREWQYIEWLLPQNENMNFTEGFAETYEQNFEINMEVDDDYDVRQRISRDELEGYDLNIHNVKARAVYSVSVNSLNVQQMEIQDNITELKKMKAQDYINYCNQISYLEYLRYDVLNKRICLQRHLKEMNTMKESNIGRLTTHAIEQLNLQERWMLYRYWISQLKDALLKDFKVLEERFMKAAKRYEEVHHMIDLEIMKNVSVVGMTTTYAARYQTLLKALKPKIVIVEEAAEVLESHIIVSLTNQCQHLILIGDHQQLRPSTSVYRMAREYKLDVSLFERMLNNGMHCEVLKVQHRMRPEIASLISPTIYPELNNHEEVTRFEEILGVTKSLFFIDHTHPDEEVGDSCSRKNEREGQFLIALCKHLVLQGYEADNITILATYTAQMFYMKNLSRQYELLKNVHITVVDNFQGEESDIILLSLVRSNEEGNIGFLKIENRVCVALSRARKGMYIMGNMKNLTENSDIWPKINETLQHLGSIGKGLELQCQVHPMEKRIVSSAEDFSDIPEGGCSLICDCLLACGHHCKKICHVIDREHNNYNCPVTPCDKVMCVLGHKCKKSCFEDCGPCLVIVQRNLPCGHEVHLPCHENYLDYKCTVRVKKVIPDCKHENEMDCWMNPSKFTCLVPCTSRLDDCGHTCRLKCHVNKDPDHLDYKCMKPCPLTNAQCSKDHPCTKRCYEECGLCEEIVVKESPACGHKNKMPCHLDPIQFDCLDKCERTMKCGHKCKNSCYEPCDGCNVVVEKTIPDCGHKIKLRCSTVPERSMCRKPCERTLDCGHTCKLECGKTCEIECKEFVESHTVAGCGHVVQLPCYKRAGIQSNSEELLSYCRMKCNADLQCGHKCLGTCYDCLQGRIHVPCKMNCGRILICGHKCGTPCASSCPPCNKKCEMRCYHNRCNKTCGQPCTPCSEKCNWICEHYKCTKRCSEPCNRPPCEHPCKKKLKCGHPCIGFCGEPCPRLCRICNKEEVTTIKLGSEDEDDARFVLLEDCSHIVEARDLEYWLLVSNKGEITIAQCPLCKTTIKRNRRYSNIIKERYKAICEVKTKVFGEKKRIMNSRNVYFQKIRPWKEFVDFRTGTFNRPKFGRPTRQEVPYTVLLDTKNFKLLVDFLFESLNIRGKKNRKNTWSNNDMETLGIQTDILCEMAENVHKIEYVLIPETKSILLTYMDVILKVLRARIRCLSSEEVDNLNLEAQRFHRIVTMCALESVPNFRKLSLESKKRYMLTVHNPLLSINKYSAEQDNVLKAELEKFLKDVGGLTITTDVERKQIVKALGMRPGHWFKCPNGHFYIITECGGAMEVGRCNECGAQIGGEDHALLTTNRHASEMDNSKFPAWSEAANLANFDLNLML